MLPKSEPTTEPTIEEQPSSECKEAVPSLDETQPSNVSTPIPIAPSR